MGGGASAESSLTFETGTDIAVEVGGGGNGSNTIFSRSFNLGGLGNDSVLSTITSEQGSGGAAGDGGGQHTTLSGSAGGRSHFAGGRNENIITSPTQGNFSGYSSTSNIFTCGGGGGAGSAGGNGNGNSTSGNGGNGQSSSITGSSVARAGGGGGAGSFISDASGGFGTGPAGGGNAGSGGGSNGTANFGGGGGAGCGRNNNGGGGDGGSGVVIILYPDTRSITFGAGVTGTETDRGDGFKYATITQGSGNVSFS